jgi:hypothetical protein
MKRSSFTSISIRSPKLLILNNIGNFFMSIIIIIPNLFEDKNDKKIVSIFYYLTNFLLVIPFCLRFQRIVKCCDIKSDERLDLQELYNKRQLYEENYYLKFTLIVFAILTVILVVSDSIITFDDVFTVNFLYKDLNNEPNLIKIKGIIWQVISFIEHIIILTYVYKIFVNKLKQKLRFEVISFFIIWFIYSNIVSLLDNPDNNKNNDELITYISLGVCYLFLFLNAVLPILISFSYKYSTCYHFTPKLMNNLYLFLSNENCYKQFSNYLNGLNANASYHLKLYTQIMNYKLGFKLKIDNNQGFLEACAIRDEHFNNVNADGKLSKEAFDNVKKECEGLANNHFTEDMFDDALQYSFNELGRYFNDFRKTDSFKELYEEFYLTSYIQCKMCNVGLINKF